MFTKLFCRGKLDERETLFACFAQAILYLDNSVECGVTFDFCLGTRFDDDSDPQSLMPGGISGMLLMTEVVLLPGWPLRRRRFAEFASRWSLRPRVNLSQ
jgi:hypothetical protein